MLGPARWQIAAATSAIERDDLPRHPLIAARSDATRARRSKLPAALEAAGDTTYESTHMR